MELLSRVAKATHATQETNSERPHVTPQSAANGSLRHTRKNSELSASTAVGSGHK